MIFFLDGGDGGWRLTPLLSGRFYVVSSELRDAVHKRFPLRLQNREYDFLLQAENRKS